MKREFTLKDDNGIELNLPPSYDFTFLFKICSILKKLNISFNSKCALHVHIDMKNNSLEDVEKVKKYYLKNQDEIIKEAGNLYIDLNKPVKEKMFQKFKQYNLYCYCAFNI